MDYFVVVKTNKNNCLENNLISFWSTYSYVYFNVLEKSRKNEQFVNNRYKPNKIYSYQNNLPKASK